MQFQAIPRKRVAGFLALLASAILFYFAPDSQASDHPAMGYEIVAIVDKAVRFHGADTREAVTQEAGELVSPTGQTLTVFTLDSPDSSGARDWSHFATWDISTGKEVPLEGKKKSLRTTKTGFFRVNFLDIDYFSKKFKVSMPFAVGYDWLDGYYIHGTSQNQCNKTISTRGSAGCTRLCPEDAKTFFELVKARGKGPVAKINHKSGEVSFRQDKKTGQLKPILNSRSKNNSYYRLLVINTDTTPQNWRSTYPASLEDWDTINIDPRAFIESPRLIQRLFRRP